MIVKLVCADCGKEIRPHNTHSLIPDEIIIEIRICGCKIIDCTDCKDLKILHKTEKELEKTVKGLEEKLEAAQEALK